MSAIMITFKSISLSPLFSCLLFSHTYYVIKRALQCHSPSTEEVKDDMVFSDLRMNVLLFCCWIANESYWMN